MRIGIYGGSFDPIHIAHLILAEQAREQGKLDRVLFIPAGKQPLKAAGALTTFEKRVEMVEAAIAGNPAFEVDTCEGNRPGPSYTVDTLKDLRQRYPKAELILILGSDCIPDLPKWREPEAIAKLATLLLVSRPGTETAMPPSYFRWQKVECPLMEVSSTDIRQRLKENRSARYLLPEGVERILTAHNEKTSP